MIRPYSTVKCLGLQPMVTYEMYQFSFPSLWPSDFEKGGQVYFTIYYGIDSLDHLFVCATTKNWSKLEIFFGFILEASQQELISVD
jgi:hypothetical protein